MAKYYRQKTRRSEDYTSGKYQPCWTCSRCFGGCSWSRDFIPVEGWNAIETYIPENGEHAKSYKIISCPQYKREVK